MKQANIPVEEYAAFEIDKYANAVSRFNFPDITRFGDVLAADFSMFAGFDMVIGGSPCTFWSCAKNNRRELDKSGIGWKLFMQFVTAVKIVRPKWFLYENVASMPATIKAYITEEFGAEPILINSALVSAQQRKRLYWTNIPGVTQPADRGILLKDILESGMAGKEKSYCIDACYYKGGNHTSPHKQSGKRLMVYEPIGAALRTRADDNGKFKRLEVRKDSKLNSITTMQTDSVICTPVRLGDIGNGGQGARVYSVRGKSVCLAAKGGGWGALGGGLYKIDLPDGDYLIRKLSPIEAERCQTLPDAYTALGVDDKGKTITISDTQRYKCVGNGWTIAVIAHILSHIEQEARTFATKNKATAKASVRKRAAGKK